MSLAVFGFEIEQRITEAITYHVTTTAWAAAPTDVTAKLYDIQDSWKDVSATCLLGDVSVVGDVITLPQVRGLTANRSYFLDVVFKSGGDTFGFYLRLFCLR